MLAGTAVAASLAIGPLIALAGAAATALSPTLAVFYAAHAITGIGVACLLSAGFAGENQPYQARERTAPSGRLELLHRLSARNGPATQGRALST